MSGFVQVPGHLAPRVLAISGAALAANTGNTTENTQLTISVPANSMGPNGFLRIITHWSYTANTNSKTVRVKFGGTTFSSIVHAAGTATTSQFLTLIQNRNATNSQVGAGSTTTGIQTSAVPAIVTASIDTTAAVDLVFTAQCVTSGTDSITLDRYIVEVCYAP
jgi:hypothetical protein